LFVFADRTQRVAVAFFSLRAQPVGFRPFCTPGSTYRIFAGVAGLERNRVLGKSFARSCANIRTVSSGIAPVGHTCDSETGSIVEFDGLRRGSRRLRQGRRRDEPRVGSIDKQIELLSLSHRQGDECVATPQFLLFRSDEIRASVTN